MEQIVRSTPGAADVENSLETSKPELRIRIDREKASDLGINVGLIATTVRAMVDGYVATQFQEGGDQYDVRVQLRREDVAGTAWNLVGFQTRLTWPEQRRVFRGFLPGLAQAEFVRQAVPMLEALPFVERYAWFGAVLLDVRSKIEVRKDPVPARPRPVTRS